MTMSHYYTFDIPDGYQVTDKTDEMVTMQVDEDHPIIVYKLDSVADVDSFISLLETTGCELVSEDAFQAGSFNVTPYAYTYLDAQGFFYICDDGKGTPILVASSGPSTEDPLTVDDTLFLYYYIIFKRWSCGYFLIRLSQY